MNLDKSKYYNYVGSTFIFKDAAFVQDLQETKMFFDADVILNCEEPSELYFSFTYWVFRRLLVF